MRSLECLLESFQKEIYLSGVQLMLKLIKDFKDFLDFKKELSEFLTLKEKFEKNKKILNLLDELQKIEIEIKAIESYGVKSRFIALHLEKKIHRQKELLQILTKISEEYS